ncbi:MAG TPA: flap endonuclease-1 [Candidatus Thermoplasmatota archaeon]|nr:flap endonuclease-1 [Candidatus Thermoplasmatota archaeon]
MGIDLGDLVQHRETTLASYAGRRLAIDAWNILYQFLASIRQPDGTPLMDAQGRVTSHLAGTLYRTGSLVEAGIQPVFVFDGEPHPLKRATLAERAMRKVEAQAAYEEAVAAGDFEKARSKAQQTSRLTSAMVEETRELLGALGIPCIQAAGEGEAQAAQMAAKGQVAAAVSQDYDALLFGTPLLVRNLTVTGRRKLPGKQVWVEVAPEEIPLAPSLEALGLSREQLVDAAILIGTDFQPGVKGVGPKKALELIRKEGSLDALLRRLAANPASASSAAERAVAKQAGDLAERDEVRRIFLEPPHAEAGDLTPRPLDAERVRRFMVDGRGFSPDRVEAALARFQAARSRGTQKTLF